MAKLVYGVGVTDININSDYLKHWYAIWRAMICRSVCEKFKNKYKNYQNVSVCDDWIYFSKFIMDVSSIKNSNMSIECGWHMDKDILIRNNKTYSKETVCFVPKDINNLFIKRGKLRGDFPIGVSYHKPLGKFRAQINKDKKKIHLGLFDSVDDAFLAYKVAKESHVKFVANRWKSEIAYDVYNAMIDYKVEIND